MRGAACGAGTTTSTSTPTYEQIHHGNSRTSPDLVMESKGWSRARGGGRHSGGRGWGRCSTLLCQYLHRVSSPRSALCTTQQLWDGQQECARWPCNQPDLHLNAYLKECWLSVRGSFQSSCMACQDEFMGKHTGTGFHSDSSLMPTQHCHVRFGLFI